MNKFITVKQLAAELPISEMGIRRRVRDGSLPALRFGRKIILDRDAVLATLQGATHDVQENGNCHHA